MRKGWSMAAISRPDELRRRSQARRRGEHRELVAAEARDAGIGARGRDEPLSGLLDQQVPDPVPDRVVDGLEVVEVEEHQRLSLARRGPGSANDASASSPSRIRFGSPVSWS